MVDANARGRDRFDVAIAGGGVTGRSLALALTTLPVETRRPHRARRRSGRHQWRICERINRRTSVLSSQLDDQFTMSDHLGKPERYEAAIADARKVTDPALHRSVVIGSSQFQFYACEGAATRIAAKCGAALGLSSSVRIITLRMPGAISLSSSNNFAPKPNSAVRKPVTLPPGRARFCTIPKPTGSVTAANTIGTARVTFSSAMTLDGAIAKTTSGASPTNSFAFSRKSSLSTPKRISTRRFIPGIQPKSCRPFLNAATRAAISASVSGPFTNMPMRRTCWSCWARAVSGHAPAATATPISVMNLRRCMCSPPNTPHPA